MIATFGNMIEACGTKAFLMRRALTYNFLSAVAQGLAYALLIPLLSEVVDSSSNAWWYLAVIGALVGMDAGLRLAANRTEWLIYIEVSDETRAALGEQLKRMPLQRLMQRRSGDLSTVLTGNVNDAVSIAGGLFAVVINVIVAPAVTIIAVFFVDWRIAIALVAIFLTATPLYRVIRMHGARSSQIAARAHADAASQVVEYTQCLAVLKATRQTGPASQRLQASLHRLREVQDRGLRLFTMPAVIISTIIQTGILAVTGVGVALVLDGSLGMGPLLAIIVISVRFSEPLALFANLSVMFDGMQAAMDRIGELLGIDPLPTIHGACTPASAQLTFERVTFSYDDSLSPTVHDVSFTASERSLTALVGSSGSGKTTISRLATRFTDPQQGAITLGGVDLRAMDQSELMQHFSLVFQDVYLFDDTIRENIRLAKPDATEREIVLAASAANCHDFVMAMQDGYDTVVGENGAALSRGERQRISIARAILKDAPIVILDEPTSALDTESEVAVQHAIDALVQDKTVLVISHRLATIVAADTILVIESGKIVEHGTHPQLLAANGRYAELWKAQRSARQWRVTD